MSINKFIGIGNITRDAEVRTVGQSQVAKFGLAMNERYKKQDGTMAETTEFIDVEYWGNAGVHQYLVKGQMVYVEGSIRTEKWTGQDGQPRYTTKIRAMSVQLLGRPQQTQTAPAPQPQYQQAPAPQPQYNQAPPQYQQAPAPQPNYQQAAYQQRNQPAPMPQYQQAPQPAPQYPQAPQAAPDQDADLPFNYDLG